MLTSCDDSSLVVDRLRDQTRGQNTPVTCFYFDFAARKEQSATSMLGSLLKQMISEVGKIPEEILRALREQKGAVSGCRPQLGDIVKILQLITSSQRTFMVIDALDECTVRQRFRLFDSLKEILEKSPSARVFVTGPTFAVKSRGALPEEWLVCRLVPPEMISSDSFVLDSVRTKPRMPWMRFWRQAFWRRYPEVYRKCG